ncbi:MAG: hypothetical protein JETT_1335 [Candidatus Jettenia ecosi]|uniref:Uncharacterized protein n=1 Tax=Candidatus Jettenia ecosi TaxID=2494326 RepID=A0A533QI79_9BACT|nr:MAG: hypothetical protein JETT_1335 [Candidatus Jettenia ecosi]
MKKIRRFKESYKSSAHRGACPHEIYPRENGEWGNAEVAENVIEV